MGVILDISAPFFPSNRFSNNPRLTSYTLNLVLEEPQMYGLLFFFNYLELILIEEDIRNSN